MDEWGLSLLVAYEELQSILVEKHGTATHPGLAVRKQRTNRKWGVPVRSQ